MLLGVLEKAKSHRDEHIEEIPQTAEHEKHSRSMFCLLNDGRAEEVRNYGGQSVGGDIHFTVSLVLVLLVQVNGDHDEGGEGHSQQEKIEREDEDVVANTFFIVILGLLLLQVLIRYFQLHPLV